MEAEYKAVSDALCEAMRMTMRSIIENLKHIGIPSHTIRNYLQEDEVCIHYIYNTCQIEDLCTKALVSNLNQRFVGLIGPLNVTKNAVTAYRSTPPRS